MTASADARLRDGAHELLLGVAFVPLLTREHMPFKGHRTVAEVWADEVSASVRRGLGR